MKRYSPFQKIMAMILSLVLVIGLIPTFAIADDGSGTDTRVVDPNTMNQWTDYFSDLSTEFAGGVWTDKSVMTNADDFMAEITMDDPDNNFLIALSALAANQKVVGYASAPMDVMLVLDVSGSMDNNGKDTAMIEAANQAIDSLLSQNNNNRVGVVLYSGNSNTSQGAGTDTATVILPLDHYTTTSTTTIGSGQDRQEIPAYLTLSNNDDVSVASGVRDSDSKQVRTGSKNVSGGTYIQNGLYQAWGEFSKVTDTVVPAGNAQAGAQRTPVMILMSDGQPTLATESYNSVGDAQFAYGNGSEDSTSWQTVFLTQLTASWVRGKMEAHYKTTPKFYTLGLGTGTSNYATAVLNPSATYNTLNTYWNRFFSNTVNSSGNVNVGTSFGSWRIYKDSNVKTQQYVDQYWLAAKTSDLLAAFASIVEAIELDAADHVTLVEDIGEDMSGYITFTDELGMFMEVKDVKGLVLGDTLFTGHELAKSLQESSMGTQEDPTEYGDEFISTVRERLGIDNVTDAQSLVMAAYADGQLAYDAATEEYSNYIGWYSNDAGDYLGFWDKDTGITADGAPDGATWINKSYGYLGTAGDSDMMHVVVMISTHIESGMQVVQYKIPASLIPTVTYEIELEGSDPTKMKSITRTEAFPLRLVYEVGLQDGINSVNVERKLQEAIDAGWGHAHAEEDGSYAFYTNLWGAEEGDSSVDYNDPLNHQVAQSHFHPAVGNDRYYYTEDTPVYVKSGDSYVLYTGSEAPAGDGYYRAHHYYTASGYTTEYLPMSEYALQMAAANGQAQGGGWHIPEGAVFQQIDRFHLPKSENATGTLEYYDYPVVVDIGDKYDVYAFLGNNGKITVAPAQGIKLTKTVTEAVEGADDTFTFEITLSQAVAAPNVTDADGNAFTGEWSVDGKVITVELKADQTVYITGLPTGVTYTVEEAPSADYNASSDNATGTVEENKVSAVDFVNTPKGYGSLIVSKDVDHPYTTVPEALTNKEFTINVTLSGPDTANKQFLIEGTEPAQYVTTDANGTFSVTLKDNGSLTVVGLPEGTTFTTTETLNATTHKGFAMDAERSILSGTIVKDTAVQTHVVNVYAPSSPVATIDVVGTKTLTDAAGTFDWTGKSFTVRLEQYDPATGTYTTVDETTVTEGALDFAFVDKLEFNAIGTYYYKVSEVIPQERLEGMSYDATVGRFEVRVTDNDVNGELEFEVYDFDTHEQITGSDYVYTYEKNFENVHTTDATYVEFTVDKNVVDPHNTGITEAGYLFELYEVTDGVTATVPAYSMRTVLVDGQGQATFHIPVTEVGSRTFILKESAPLDADKIPGMRYDTSEYTVTVSATAEDGKLVPAVTAQKNGTAVTVEELAFENVLELEPLVLEPYVTKTLIGREPLNDSEFTFNIVQTDGSFATAIEGGYSDTVSVGEGDKHFEKITVTTVGTYYFRTTEVIGSAGGMTYDNSIYHITVNVTAEDGKLVKDVTYVKVGEGVPSTETDFVQFTNTYVNNDTAEIRLEGEKSLTGRSVITGEFSFQLKEDGDVLQTVANRADRSFVFDTITYTAADVGTHTYTITEVNDGKGGVSYDGSTYTVTVTVTDNGDGTLSVSQPVYKKGNSEADKAVFYNTYSTTDAEVTFGGTKTWYDTDLDRDKEMTGGEFTFVLYGSDEDYSVQGDEVATATNSSSGNFSFTLEYDTAGSYYYLLREQIGDAAGVSYDTGVYRIKVSVYDNGVGKLVGVVSEIYKVGTGDDTITFGNRYTPGATEVVIKGEKELTMHEALDGEFSFQLFAADDKFNATGEALQTVSNANGEFVFEAIPYEKSGTRYYVVKEVIPQQAVDNVYKGITYDTTVFGVTVSVTDENGQLKAAYTVTDTADGSAAALKFVNEYSITQYTDFDLSGKKLLNDANGDPMDLGGGEFTFELYDANGVRIETATNEADGSFLFSNIPLTEAREYTFTVKEQPGELGGITYDSREYTVTVNVTDDGEGNLVAGTPVIRLGSNAAALEFTNTYKLEKTSAQFRVQKILENKNLTADMFQFQLVDSQNKVLQTKGNLLGGGVVFDAIEYLQPGEHSYTIREVVPEGGVKDGITYDGHTVAVKVSVTDNGDGTMTADVTYEGLREFTNTYNVTGEPAFSISGTKELTGRDIENGEFTFVLTDAQGNELETVNTGKSFSFINVALPGLGTHTFTVTEKNTGKGGVSYDANEYKISVTVTDDGKGGMTVGAPIVTHNGVAAHLVFRNGYTVKPATYVLSATKSYDKTLTGGEFEFLLTGEGENQTKKNAAGGAITFDELSFSEVKTYTYTVTEKAGDKSYIGYDDTVYTVKIDVKDDGKGQLYVASVSYSNNKNSGTGPVAFTNTYTAQPATYVLSATKSYDKTLTGGEFEFLLTGEGENQTKKNAAGGAITFDELSFSEVKTYTYTVTEKAGDKSYIGYDDTVYTVKIDVKDDGKGQLYVASVSYSNNKNSGTGPVAFTNTYTAQPATYVLSATKSYDKTLTGGEFEFLLTGEGENQTKKNAAGGAITFDELSFNEVKTYTYTVTEKAGDKSYITYDDTVYTVAIEVADDNQGQLYVKNVTVSDNKNSGNETVKFDNAYVITGEPVFSISGTKNLSGRDLEDGEFTFVLTDAQGNEIEVGNVGKSFCFSNVALPGLGTHTFTVTEKNTGVGTITYDAAKYTVSVTVVDNNEGGMTVETPVVTLDGKEAELVFSNVYTEPDPITVEVNIGKTVDGTLSPKDFKFELVHSGKVIATVTTDENGKAVLPVTFTVADVGSHEFVLREADTGVKHVIYDKTQYKLLVDITETADGQLAAAVKLDGASVEAVSVKFVNKYAPPASPENGDSTDPVMLMGIMGASALAIITLLAVLVLDKKKGAFER